MPRQARKRSQSGIYHLMLRGINKQNIFEDDEDRQKLIETIVLYKGISKYELYGYCLMDNHIHILMKENEETVSQIVKRISSRYVYWYNQKYERCGHLFQERFKSEPVETDAYFIMVLRYIHQNPIKAGIIKGIEEYMWSSYHEYLAIREIVDIDFALGLYSDDKNRAQQLLKEYTKAENTDICLEYEEIFRISDGEIMELLKRLGVVTISGLQRLPRDQRDEVIKRIKAQKGVTIRQLARITGISKSVIERI